MRVNPINGLATKLARVNFLRYPAPFPDSCSGFSFIFLITSQMWKEKKPGSGLLKWIRIPHGYWIGNTPQAKLMLRILTAKPKQENAFPRKLPTWRISKNLTRIRFSRENFQDGRTEITPFAGVFLWKIRKLRKVFSFLLRTLYLFL